ncbi:MAG: AgmX/PglI C-terminal domain-containing protein [Deltaproteobacteria bacterium]|nr:AgmX/PglI C-terminal domain-containing protein [Deltaproteobacteria bacterium]
MRFPAPALALATLVLVGCGARVPQPVSTTRTTAAVLVAPVVAAEPPPPEPEAKSPPPNAERTIARARLRLRACYERGLALDPHMPGGALRLHVRVAPDGVVRTVDASKRTGLSTVVESCVVEGMRATRFDPSSEPGVIDVPLHFVRHR